MFEQYTCRDTRCTTNRPFPKSTALLSLSLSLLLLLFGLHKCTTFKSKTKLSISIQRKVLQNSSRLYHHILSSNCPHPQISHTLMPTLLYYYYCYYYWVLWKVSLFTQTMFNREKERQRLHLSSCLQHRATTVLVGVRGVEKEGEKRRARKFRTGPDRTGQLEYTSIHKSFASNGIVLVRLDRSIKIPVHKVKG